MSVYSNPASSAAADTEAYVSALLELLGERDPVDVLRETPAAIQRLLEKTPADIVETPEAPGKWSMRQVLAHLADSELVGGFRLRMIVSHDRPTIIGYDQDLWADRLGYSNVTVADAVEQFTALRRANVRIWARLTPSDLTRVGVHSERGEESLGHMRKLYAAHDLLHLNQLNRIRMSVGRGDR